MTAPTTTQASPQTATASAPLDPRTAYSAALRQTAGIVAGVTPAQFDLPTPCDEYDVKTLMSHMVGGIKRIAHVGGGGDFSEVEPWADGVAPIDLPAAYAEAALAAENAWAPDATMTTMASVPWGVVPGKIALSGYVMELLTHGWDLATATGQPSEGDPQLAELALMVARLAVPVDARDDVDMPFETVVEVGPEAGPYAQLAGFLGRQV